jgi:trans-2,3-dihydro-3-hydroxyanthranilate isomerase
MTRERTFTFYTTDVFTDRVFGGNPLAVLTDARGLSGDEMQRIAREFNLSETVFVLPPSESRHTRRVRIFTPGAELPFAGHPTVGTAFVLAWSGAIELRGETTRIVLEEGVGPVPVTVRARDGRPVFAQLSAARLPERGPDPPPADEIAALLSLEPSDLLPGEPPQAWSAGVPFLFVPVASRDALARARVRMEVWQRVLASYWAPQPFVFTYDTGSDDVQVRARMFSPGLGIIEDPATGSAAATLAGYLFERGATTSGVRSWTVEQGVEMGRPSRLEVEAEVEGGRLVAARVGGPAVPVSEGTIKVPAEGGLGAPE